MAYLRNLVAFASLAAAGAANAFVFPSPPPGFGGTPGGWTFAPPSGVEQIGKIMKQPGGLTVPTGGGGNVKMPVAYRLAANAPRFGAALIMQHPAVRTAMGIATLLGAVGLVYNVTSGLWEKTVTADQFIPDGFQYLSPPSTWVDDPGVACKAIVSSLPKGGGDQVYTHTFQGLEGSAPATYCLVKTIDTYQGNPRPASYGLYPLSTRPTGCPIGSVPTPAGCIVKTTQGIPVQDPDEFHRILNPDNEPGWPATWPQTIPKELPASPWPVEVPVPNPSPGVNPSPQPMFVPTGRPVPNPEYDPNAQPSPTNQPFMQPGVRLTPSPTLNEPWRMAVEPVNRPVASPEGAPEPSPEPLPEGSEPGDSSSDKPKTEQDQSLCEKHPDIVACQKLGDLQPEKLPSKTVPMELKREEGFGPSNGTCPPPKQFVVLGKSMSFRWDLLCDFASGIRPLLIGFAYLSAALAFLGLSRKEA